MDFTLKNKKNKILKLQLLKTLKENGKGWLDPYVLKIPIVG